jgi:hypothetical protein
MCTAAIFTEHDFVEIERLLGDPAVIFLNFTLFGAWDRRPR